MTTITLTTAVILVLCCAYSWRTGECRTFNCLYSRLDSFNCTPPQGHTDWPWPGPNTYALFRTRIGRNSTSSHPYCEYRTPRYNRFSEMIRDIDDLGDQNVKLLYSPGYLLGRRYANSMLVSYNVECPEGRLPFLVYKDFYLRGTVCYGRCEDYVTISCTTCGTSESCGTKPTDNFYHLGQRQFSVTFRTSRARNDNGFELSVICFDPGLSNPGDKKKRDLEIFRNEWLEEAERSRRQVAIPPQRVLVSLSDVVTYRINTINVSKEGQLIRRIENIDCLVIEDTSGEGRLFLGDAVELRPDGTSETIQLSGPGELLLLPNNATFIRDSKAFTPPAFGQRVVTVLTNELFNVISLKNDHYIAEDLEEEDIDETNTTESQPQVPSHLGGRRSAERYEDEQDLSAIQPQVPSHFNHRRSAVGTPSTDCLISTSAISLAILYESSSNPVVSTIATSVLNIATRQSPLCVQSVRVRDYC